MGPRTWAVCVNDWHGPFAEPGGPAWIEDSGYQIVLAPRLDLPTLRQRVASGQSTASIAAADKMDVVWLVNAVDAAGLAGRTLRGVCKAAGMPRQTKLSKLIGELQSLGKLCTRSPSPSAEAGSRAAGRGSGLMEGLAAALGGLQGPSIHRFVDHRAHLTPAGISRWRRA